MRKRGAKENQGSGVGEMLAIPLLFSLMALAAAIYATSVAMVFAERKELEPATHESIVEVERARHASVDLVNLDDQVAEFRREIERYSPEQQRSSLLEALRAEREATQSELESAQQDLEQLEDEQASLRHQQRDADHQRQRLQGRSLEDLDRAVLALAEEIAAIENRVQQIIRKKEDDKTVAADRLVPGGAQRSAVFVECERDGVRIMPGGNFFSTPVQAAARQHLLHHAKQSRYVVFLIRPLGFDSFLEYRQVVNDYNNRNPDHIDFGFEPIDAEWMMTY